MISIIMAVYNEEKLIKESIAKVQRYVVSHGLEYEIVVVDDGSTDQTFTILKKIAQDNSIKLISYEKNKGKGYALRTGVKISTGDIILLSDADLSTPINEMNILLPFIESCEYDLVIGSRAMQKSRIIKKQPWWRQGMGKVFNKIVKLLIISDFSDTQCGFKILSGDIARYLFKKAKINRFAYDVEILALAKKSGHKIIEMPVKWINSPDSKVRPIRDSAKMLFDLFRIKFFMINW